MQYLNEDGSNPIEILHKYVRINQYLFSTLINNEIWFSDPDGFNDPYDCNINYDFSDISYEKVYKHLLNSNKKFNFGKSDDYIKGRATDICNNPMKLEQLMNGFLKNTTNKRGIACFSESDNILLMWSHYADSHKGVCLTFDIEKDLDFFSIPYKVDYLSNYPKINPFNVPENKEVQLVLATKSNEWAYEQEIRIVKNKDNNPKFRGPIAFNPEALTEIKFGYKCSDEQIRTVKNLVTKKYSQIKLYTSKIKIGVFGIEFHPIN